MNITCTSYNINNYYQRIGIWSKAKARHNKVSKAIVNFGSFFGEG
jgi:hypothetical protein